MMARILIVEPHPEVRDLLVRIVERLGHTGVRLEDDQFGDAAADAALLEPGDEDALEVARDLHDRGMPLVCVSIHPRSPEVEALEPAAYVLKPFALSEIERAIDAALEQTAGAPALRSA
jgi:DNA-binding response OmpR family regulator